MDRKLLRQLNNLNSLTIYAYYRPLYLCATKDVYNILADLQYMTNCDKTGVSTNTW